MRPHNISGDKMSANRDLYDAAITHAADLRRHEDLLDTQMNRIIRRHEDRLDKLAATGQERTKYIKELSRFRKEMLIFKQDALRGIVDNELDFQSNSLFNRVGKVFKVRQAGRKGLANRLFGSGIQTNKNLDQQIGSIIKQQNDRITGFFKKNPDARGSELRAGIKQTTALTKGQLGSLLTTSITQAEATVLLETCLLYTSPSPRDS